MTCGAERTRDRRVDIGGTGDVTPRGVIGRRVATFANALARGTTTCIRWRRNVTRRLAGRADAVVTPGTRRRRTDVAEHGAGPANRRVAKAAFQTGVDMFRSLALGLHPVVAGSATTHDLSVIEVHRRTPAHRRMASGANIRSQYMRDGFRGGAYRRAHAMTSRTVARRTLENCVDVAGLAR